MHKQSRQFRSFEDAIEAGPQLGFAPGAWLGAIGLEVGVQPPDQAADLFLGGTGRGGEGLDLVDQPLGVDPTQSVLTDVELPGVVRDDDRAVEEAMGDDGAPQRPFGGDRHRIGVSRHPGDAEVVEMGLPGGRVSEVSRRVPPTHEVDTDSRTAHRKSSDIYTKRGTTF